MVIMPKNELNEKQYYVSGMHCASCELLIEMMETDIIKNKFCQKIIIGFSIWVN